MSKTNATTVQILSSLQNRVSCVSKRLTLVEDKIETINSLFEITENKVDAITTNAAKGFVEQKQAIADNAAGTTYALNALKSSTQTGFDGVRDDIATVQTALTKFNARISGLEGQDKSDAEAVYGIRERLSKLEASASYEDGSRSTPTLEIELKALLTRYGYQVTGVTVAKNTYAGIVGISNSSLASLQAAANTRGTENIEVKIGGLKAL